jgi:hypothetical protein
MPGELGGTDPDKVVRIEFGETLHDGTPPSLLIGPFTEYCVVVEGRDIPGLTGYPDGDKIALVVDRRFSASFAPEDAHQAAWLIAQALAIGAGYPWLGATSKNQPFAAQAMELKTPPA